jgi:hypothetical protein
VAAAFGDDLDAQTKHAAMQTAQHGGHADVVQWLARGLRECWPG